MVWWISVLFFVVAAQARHEQYEGHTLYRVYGPPDLLEYIDDYVDILSARPVAMSTSRKLEVLLRLSPEEKSKWLQYFDDHQMSYKLVSDNLAQILRAEDSDIKRSRENEDSNSAMTWDKYYNTDEINKHLDELGAKYPDLVTVVNAGLSYEGRQIKYVRISTTRFEDLRKRVIVIDAGVHAREWVAPPVALYLLQQLVEGTDKTLTENLDWIILPMANPDGYEYSINTDRMWRKTRSKSHPGSDTCPGVDGNRNFDLDWGTREQLRDPCRYSYEGPSAFSEPETRIIRDVILSILDRSSLYISLHSHGSQILYPWGNNGTLPPNGLTLHVTGITMATEIEKLKLENAKAYVVGNAALTLYSDTGTSRDWTRSVGVPLTYTLELPGYEYEFIVPPTYIQQIVTETYAGLAAGAHYVLSLYG